MCVFGLKYFRLRQEVKHLYKLLTCACGFCLFGVLVSMIYIKFWGFSSVSPTIFLLCIRKLFYLNFDLFSDLFCFHTLGQATVAFSHLFDCFAFNYPPSLSPDPHRSLWMSCWPLVQFSLTLLWAVLQIPVGSHQSSLLCAVHQPAPYSWLPFPYCSPALSCSLLPT